MLPVQKWIRAKLHRLVPIVMVCGLLTGGILVTQVVASSPAFAGTDTYPTSIAGCKIPSTGKVVTCDLKDSAQDTYFDPWGEYNRECTSYVAWMLHSVNGFEMPFNADASQWVTKAQALNYTVNTTPAYGAVAWMSIGHVAWVEQVNSDGTVNTEDYNYSYDGTYAEHLNQSAKTYQEYIHFQDPSGGGSSGGGSTSNGYEIAFQNNTGDLWWWSSLHGSGDSGLGMATATSPAITSVSNGFEFAFQANTGNLVVYGNTVSRSTTLGMMSGTSPSIAGNVVAFQNNGGDLWIYNITTNQGSDTGLGMKSGTNPSIAPLSGGGYQIAFQNNGGQLWWYSTATGQGGNSGITMMPGTSPSDALLADHTNEIAFQRNDGNLYLFGSDANMELGLGMATNTSPSIAPISGGGAQVVFQANTGQLMWYNTTTGSGSSGITMMPGTSPSDALLADNTNEIAFQRNNGNLYLFGSDANMELGLGMAGSTNPGIA